MRIATSAPVARNANGGMYMKGKAFTELHWYRIIETYQQQVQSHIHIVYISFYLLVRSKEFSVEKYIEYIYFHYCVHNTNLLNILVATCLLLQYCMTFYLYWCTLP